MDAWGYPTDLFTVNRWVTDESWLPASTTATVLDQFTIDHAYPSWPLNRWLTAMVRGFRPQIEALLRHRDHSDRCRELGGQARGRTAKTSSGGWSERKQGHAKNPGSVRPTPGVFIRRLCPGFFAS
ncbi:DUF6969 family protein [Marinobacter sp.]|uniref:DUF6969 family protein n=1 Tax=Marinobacter sp. TaxID=50741 RepID=UPI003974D05F